MKEITVGKNDSGQRVDRFLSKAVPLLPDSLLHKYIRLKKIKCNRKAVKENQRLAEGDVLSLYINDEFFEQPTEKNAWLKIAVPRLHILYEDSNLMLIDKKPGVLCHSSGSWEYNTLIVNIQAYLAQKGEWNYKEENAFAPALCNRIDRNTGGIVIAAKNAETLRIINEKIRNREIEKSYLCVVHGQPSPKHGRLENQLFKDAVKNQVYVKQTHEPGAKQAITEYQVLQSSKDLSLVECRLITGRTHQIRAQMAHAGWPLLGDGKYGREKINRKYGETGQALYSWKIRFQFLTDAEILNYLNGKEFSLSAREIPFIEKYFPHYTETPSV
ncbi:MAG: RluA family pseudouridine synthase [Oscillospiraceae bacterium]|nr:RluA family pseudouridine synthase [Oscillospiraceae bacterium]MBR0393065.1 RluA family pseudouridine synthase [Oscillospiraceae bacterium]